MAGATTKRDLRTGRSLWADSPGLGVRTRPLTQAIAVDVAIVGAGISGAFMAHELARDHSVAVLDRRPPLMGSTIASTGNHSSTSCARGNRSTSTYPRHQDTGSNAGREIHRLVTFLKSKSMSSLEMTLKLSFR